MDERSALAVIAARAAESAGSPREAWSDEDRAWASRAAAGIVGESASGEAFLARRAALVLERLGERGSSVPVAVASLTWRPWVGVGLVVVAAVFGVAVDRIGDAQRVNILAPPVWALLLWNLAVYAILVGRLVVHYGEPTAPGGLRRLVARVAGGSAGRAAGRDAEAVASLAREWSSVASPLYAARASRLLHLAASALALGVVAGLYVRGLALEYRAGWESTFLEAPAVRAILAALYAPGAAATGLAVPGVEAIAAIRAPAGENAARWLHLIAATLIVVVVVPRIVLAIVAALAESRRARAVALALDAPYFQRLLRAFRGGPARVRVVPYSTTPGPQALSGLERIVTRVFGGGATLQVVAPVDYGSDAPIPDAVGRTDTALALFNATATPEAEVHGAFLAALAARSTATIALVDVDALARVRGGDAAAIEARVEAWRAVAREAGVALVAANLREPDLADVEDGVDAALGGADR
jgi:hypothetical protein